VAAAAVLADHAAPEADRDRVAGQLGDLPLAAKAIEEREDRPAPDPLPAVLAEDEELRHPVVHARPHVGRWRLVDEGEADAAAR
jgi:hypothetical protein